MDEGLVKIILALIFIFTGISVVVKIIINRSKDKSKTVQKGNIVLGDQAGRDIKKNKENG